MQDLAACAARALRHGGRLALCQRPERLAETCAVLSAAGLEPKRLALVKNKAGGRPWLFLMQARKGGKLGLELLPDVLIEAGAALYGANHVKTIIET